MFSARNLNDFLKNKPPLVIFTLCLIILAVTTFSFAFYIQHTSLKDLTNTDVKENWVTLKKHFNKLHIYVQDNRTSKLNLASTEYSDKHSVYAVVTVKDLTNLKDFTYIQGILTLEGWISNCPKFLQKPDFMMISFSLPNAESIMNQTHICVEITGPREYLPQFSEPVCHVNKPTKPPDATGILRSINLSDNSEVIKENGVQIKLTFDPDGNENFVVHLKPDDVAVIYMHLMWCSYTLVFIVIVILLYAVFRKNKEVVDI